MRFTIVLICAVMMLAGFAYAGGEGQDDTTIRSDYTDAFQARIFSYTPNLWRIDGDSSEIIQALNDALLEVSKLARATERVDTIVMDSTLWYGLADDFQKVSRVAIKDPTGPGEVGLDSIWGVDIGQNTVAGTGPPKYYTIWNRQIYFDRNNYLLDTVWVYYNAYSANLDLDTTTSNVSKYYFNIVVDEAILNFYGGRVGTAVPQILALADRRLISEYAKLGIQYKSITPDVR